MHDDVFGNLVCERLDRLYRVFPGQLHSFPCRAPFQYSMGAALRSRMTVGRPCKRSRVKDSRLTT